MEKVESPLDVLSRAATMVQPCPAYPASDSDGFETPSTASSGESEGDRALSPDAPLHRDATGKWRRERRTRLPEYRPKENGKMALRSQSFNERRTDGVAGGVAVVRTHTHSDGDLSDDDRPANLSVSNKGQPPEYPGTKEEAPIDMRLRPAPPPYRPSVITRSGDTPPGSISMCDPVIDEHFRRSLGDNYMALFKKSSPEATSPAPSSTIATTAPTPKPCMKDRASSPIHFHKEKQPKIIAMDVDDASVSVDDHFAKALGDTWRQIQTSRTKHSDEKKESADSKEIVDDHFSKALGDTWKKIQASKLLDDKTKDSSKIITRSGVVI